MHLRLTAGQTQGIRTGRKMVSQCRCPDHGNTVDGRGDVVGKDLCLVYKSPRHF